MSDRKVTAFVNPEQAVRAMRLLRAADKRAQKLGMPFRFPVCLVGGTGTGKTTAYNMFYADLKQKFDARIAQMKKANKLKKCAQKTFNSYVTILSSLKAEDLSGYLTNDEDKKTAFFKMLDCLPFDSYETCLIFADEYDRCEEDIQNAFMQFQLGGSYHGHFISPNAYVVMAMNGSSDMYTTQLSEAAATRVVMLYMHPKAEGALESYKNYSYDKGLPEICRQFHEQYHDSIDCRADFEELSTCNGRTLDACGFLMEEIEIQKDTIRTDDILHQLVYGQIGSKAGIDFIALQEALKDGKSPYDVFASPATLDLPNRTDQMYYLLEGCISVIQHKFEGRVAQQEKRAVACLEYGTRFEQEEWKEIWFSTFNTKLPELNLSQNDKYMAWQKYKQDKGIRV